MHRRNGDGLANMVGFAAWIPMRRRLMTAFNGWWIGRKGEMLSPEIADEEREEPCQEFPRHHVPDVICVMTNRRDRDVGVSVIHVPRTFGTRLAGRVLQEQHLHLPKELEGDVATITPGACPQRVFRHTELAVYLPDARPCHRVPPLEVVDRASTRRRCASLRSEEHTS